MPAFEARIKDELIREFARVLEDMKAQGFPMSAELASIYAKQRVSRKFNVRFH